MRMICWQSCALLPLWIYGRWDGIVECWMAEVSMPLRSLNFLLSLLCLFFLHREQILALATGA